MIALKYKISVRFYIAIGFVVTLTFAASLVGWVALNRVGDAQSRVNAESVPEIAAAFAVAQYAGDLVAATDRLSVATTPEQLAEIQEYIGRISPLLSEQVYYLEQSASVTSANPDLLTQIRANLGLLDDGVSEFEDLLLEYHALTIAGADMRHRLIGARTAWHSVKTSAMADELAYSAEHLPGEDLELLQLLLQLDDDMGAVELALSSGFQAGGAVDVHQSRESYVEALERSSRWLADLAQLPSHGNLSRSFDEFSALGLGSPNVFDVRLEELVLGEQRAQLLGANYQAALSLIDDVDILVRSAQNRAQAATDASALTIGLAQAALLAISAVSFGVALLVAWLLVSSLLARLNRLSSRMRQMAQGDLEEPVQIVGRDEVSDMASALEVFRHYALEAIRLNLVEQLAKELRERNAELAESLENLRRAQDSLVAQEKLSALGQLVSGLAHEINNPLNFVGNFSEVCAELLSDIRRDLREIRAEQLDVEHWESVEEDIDDLAQNLDRIVNNSQRASNIVQAMQALGRDRGTYQLTDINRLLNDHAMIAYQSARSADENFLLKLEFDCEEIEQIVVNSRDMGRVFLSVVTNACYATEEKRRNVSEDDCFEPTLRLSTRRLEEKVEIRIRDNGTGIRDDAIDKIFDPFFTTKPAGHGIGLGLTIAYDIVREHNGTIEAVSEPGEFTEIVIALPVVPPFEPDTEVDDNKSSSA